MDKHLIEKFIESLEQGCKSEDDRTVFSRDKNGMIREYVLPDGEKNGPGATFIDVTCRDTEARYEAAKAAQIAKVLGQEEEAK